MSTLPSFGYCHCHCHCQKASPSKRSIYNISPGSVVNMTGRINQLSGERKQWQFNKLLAVSRFSFISLPITLKPVLRVIPISCKRSISENVDCCSSFSTQIWQSCGRLKIMLLTSAVLYHWCHSMQSQEWKITLYNHSILPDLVCFSRKCCFDNEEETPVNGLHLVDLHYSWMTAEYKHNRDRKKTQLRNR